MIIHKHKFVFVHIPKTGGSSIELMFDPEKEVEHGGLSKVKHKTFGDLLKDYPPIGDYFKFTFVRNPWDLAVSLWSFLQQHNSVKAFTEDLTFEELLADGFSQKLKRIIDKHTSWDYALIKLIEYGQMHWIDSRLDFIGRTENLQSDFNQVCDQIGVEHHTLPRSNATERKHYSTYYCRRTKEMVEKRFRKDIEYFGYEF